MTTYFVSRHPGTIKWFNTQGYAIDQHLQHFDAELIQADDIVIGTLPIHIAAEVCAKGGRYIHLELNMPFEMRGKELTAHDLNKYGAKLTEFKIQKCISAS